MATFEFRSGKWRAKIVRLGVKESATFPSKSQASAWATKREAEILAGARGFSTGHTVADAIDEFIKRVVDKRNGGRWERIRLLKFQRDYPRLCAKPISRVTSDDMAKWRDERLAEVSGSSVAREMNLWGALFSIAVREWKWLMLNPVNGVKRPSEPPARRRGVDAEEVNAIKAHLNGEAGVQVLAAFLLSLETAMRAGEILGLTWDHVDLQNRVVTLPKTKNGDSRQVPLSTKALDIINSIPKKGRVAESSGVGIAGASGAIVGGGLDQLANLAPDGIRLPVGPLAILPASHEKVFTITSATLDVLFRRARDAAVKDCPSCATVRFHDARSEAITRLSRKLDVLELARVVGHRQIASLMFYYNKSAAEIAKKLG